jgi:hypothetical protein
MVFRRGLLLAFAAALVASCTTTSFLVAPVTSVLETCVDPPAAELAVESPLVISVEPNPVTAESEASLSVSDEGLLSRSIVGAATWWQCWNGTHWVDTHLVGRGWYDGTGHTVELGTTDTWGVPDIGLQIPNAFPIVIPDVEPGTYRLRDEAFTLASDDGPGDTIPGFVIVRVVPDEQG